MPETINLTIAAAASAVIVTGASWQALRRHRRGANPLFWDRN